MHMLIPGIPQPIPLPPSGLEQKEEEEEDWSDHKTCRSNRFRDNRLTQMGRRPRISIALTAAETYRPDLEQGLYLCLRGDLVGVA